MMPAPTFESLLRARLATLLSDVGAEILVDSIEAVESERLLLVDFHLEGAWSSPAGFTFPFHESASLDRGLSAMRDMISKNWQNAHMPPPVASRTSSTKRAGAD